MIFLMTQFRRFIGFFRCPTILLVVFMNASDNQSRAEDFSRSISGQLILLDGHLQTNTATGREVENQNESPERKERSPRIRLGKKNELADVFLYVVQEKAPSNLLDELPNTVDVYFSKGVINPPASFVVVGRQKLRLINQDGEAHNPSLKTLVGRSPILVEPLSSLRTYEFERSEPQPCPIRCEIHATEQSWILAVDHPWVSISDADGKFSIEHLPSKQIELRVFHENCGIIKCPNSKDGKWYVDLSQKSVDLESVKITFPGSNTSGSKTAPTLESKSIRDP